MECPDCKAYVLDTVEIDVGRVWYGTRACYRQVWRLFPCGHTMICEGGRVNV